MKRQKKGLRTAAALCIVLLCAAAAACDSSGRMTVSCRCAYSRAEIDIPVKTKVHVDGGYTAAFSSGETLEALGRRIADDWGKTGGTVTPAGDGLLLTRTVGAFSHYALLSPYDGGGYNRILCNMAGFVGGAEKMFLLPAHLLADTGGITTRRPTRRRSVRTRRLPPTAPPTISALSTRPRGRLPSLLRTIRSPCSRRPDTRTRSIFRYIRRGTRSC